MDTDPEKMLANAEKMEKIVFDAGIMIEQVHHGVDFACWAINRRALERGHGIRTGLEDVTVLPNGNNAENNVQLVQVAVSMIVRK